MPSAAGETLARYLSGGSCSREHGPPHFISRCRAPRWPIGPDARPTVDVVAVVDQFVVENRTASRPFQCVPPSQQVPSACTRALTSCVTSSESPNRTTTWFSTTSLRISTPGSAAIRPANRRAFAQQRSTRSAMPSAPISAIAAHTAKPRARRDASGA